MNRYILLYALFWLGLCSNTQAVNNLMFEKANQFYHNKQYKEAIDLYTQMLNDGFDNHELFYNLGNAYYKTKQIGWAIWCYKKALQDHKDAFYVDNLQLAEKQIAKPVVGSPDIFFLQWWKSLTHLTTKNGWAKWSLILFLVAIAAQMFRRFRNRGKQLKYLILFCFALSIFCLVMMLSLQFQRRTAIVVRDNISFNGSSSTQQASSLSAGVEVRVEQLGNSHVLVTLPDGRVGSLDKSAIKLL